MKLADSTKIQPCWTALFLIMSAPPKTATGSGNESSFTETYRLSRIPGSFSTSDVKELFNLDDQQLIRNPLSLADSVSRSGLDEKVATVTFSRRPSFADKAKVSPRDPRSFKCWENVQPSCAHVARQIRIDNSFEGLTPLNDVVIHADTVDIVACTGIYGRPFVSWQHSEGTMWLRDYLPKDLQNCRILIWGKHSQFHPGPNPSHGVVTHYRDSLIDDLCRLRDSGFHKHRPLILMGHSFGGILIKAAFVKAHQDYHEIRDTIGGLVFFGTPHDGIYVKPWLDIWGENPSQQLIRDLGPGSTLLRNLRENFEMADSARKIANYRAIKNHILTVLPDIKHYIQYRLQRSTSSLLMAESSELDNICSIFRQAKGIRLSSGTPASSSLREATKGLQVLFREGIAKAAATEMQFKERLLGNYSSEGVWGESEDITHLGNAAIPHIIQLKQAIHASFGMQNYDILQTFIKSDEAKYLGLDFVVRTKELWSKLDKQPAAPLLGKLKDLECKSGLQTATWYPTNGTVGEHVIYEHRSYAIQSSGSKYDQDSKRMASRQLAAILQGVSHKPETSDLTKSILDPTMSIFRFVGYIDEPEHERLAFLYAVPQSSQFSSRECIARSKTLDKWLRPDTKQYSLDFPRLDERFAIAYHVCRSVFNQHICGWVHKSIRPDNIVLVPTGTSESSATNGRTHTYIPYLKGFEYARATDTPSDRLSLPDQQNDVYRHQNRRGNEGFDMDFHPIHDIYAVGTVLVEIGLGKSVRDVINSLKNPRSEGRYEEDLERISNEKLSVMLGARYAHCAIKCLRGYRALGVNPEEKDIMKLAFAFRSQIVDELMRMAVACGSLVYQ
ncbi:unnamed protein product [Periconia digitata]|uniref:Protein kinase domain-containing protein n=1 Tax=Periconia digitata TaxID=1303443 RepID=A0A9W4XEX5_9PLEO|nr:unnamed protein product [Periconia digitata]